MRIINCFLSILIAGSTIQPARSEPLLTRSFRNPSTFSSEALIPSAISARFQTSFDVAKTDEVIEIVKPKKAMSRRGFGLVLFASALAAQVRTNDPTSTKILAWIKQNHMSAFPKVPKSFQVPSGTAKLVWSSITGKTSEETHLQRAIIDRGLVIYDGALAQILWMLSGNLEQAAVLTRGYMDEERISRFQGLDGSFAEGDPGHPFQYGEGTKGRLSDGQGWLFRIFADVWEKEDPLDGARVKWKDWKPVAGENAWAAMAALHLYSKKYGSKLDRGTTELKLAERLAAVALLMQSETGGVRYAPQGTFANTSDSITQNYYVISTENNLSWYATFRMLYEITKDPKYLAAMKKQETYFKSVWRKSQGTFAQGMQFTPGRGWSVTPEFATDCQSWAVLSLGTEKIDQWFGEGATYRMLSKTIDTAGVKDPKGQMAGVDFTDYHSSNRKSIVSIEWTAGFVMASRQAADAYSAKSHKDWSDDLRAKSEPMAQYIRSTGVEQNGWLAFPYATGKAADGNVSSERPTGFGWYAPVQEVLSLASTGWMAFLSLGFNPMVLGGGVAKMVALVTPSSDRNADQFNRRALFSLSA